MLDLTQCSASQSEAITHGTGPMLVLAGPGSGKTFVITRRIQYLIEYHHVPPEQILVITFTKAAATQMQERFLKLTSESFMPVTFGTFHAFFYQILKQTYHFNASSILKESDKRKMMKKIICSIGLIVAACSVAALCSSCGKKEERGELKRIWYNGSYNRDFKDLNDVHLAEAKRIGIKPASNREEAEKVKKEMEEIETNEYYEVEKLTHSIPYLIPSAAQLLEDIGHNFQDSLRNLNASIYKVKVTSVTRTVDDVKNLKKRNTNSSQNSAHRYGTTFDVSWARYTKVDESDTLNIDKDRLKMVLAMVLRDLKREERCYVKHERKQGCFHITVREKK